MLSSEKIVNLHSRPTVLFQWSKVGIFLICDCSGCILGHLKKILYYFSGDELENF